MLLRLRIQVKWDCFAIYVFGMDQKSFDFNLLYFTLPVEQQNAVF